MAEFKEVMNGAQKMCESMHCGACKTLSPFVYKVCNGNPCFCSDFGDLMGMEAEVLQFLKDNPPPVYPTWLDWLKDNVSKPIPEEIAKMLGVEPVKEDG